MKWLGVAWELWAEEELKEGDLDKDVGSDWVVYSVGRDEFLEDGKSLSKNVFSVRVGCCLYLSMFPDAMNS